MMKAEVAATGSQHTTTWLNALPSVLRDRITTARAVCEQHAGSTTVHVGRPPDAVAFPESREEIQEIVASCWAHRIPVIAHGAGTSGEGHLDAVHGGLSLDLSKMNRVLAVRTSDYCATVQPGVTREALNLELRDTGLFFSVDPGANASIGGMVATGASGTTALRYGTMRENVLSLEVVLADGTLLRCGTLARKSSAGYDLTHLMIGSEGTLGIVTEATVRLHPTPATASLVICAFPDFSAPIRCALDLISSGVTPARCEFLDAYQIAALNTYGQTNFLEQTSLFVELHGIEGGVAQETELLTGLVSEHGGHLVRNYSNGKERERLWQLRHEAAGAALRTRPGSRPWPTDVCVPLSALVEAMEQAREDLSLAGLVAPIFGHVGDGNFHAVILVDPNNPEEIARAQEVNRRMVERAIVVGGTCTGEHGIGNVKRHYLARQHPDALPIMRALKLALDPHGILNPGKIL